MPAMHLISVDLPAPLSPTRAITSPSRTSKSTSVSACTEPKDLETPRSSRRGVSLTGAVSYHRGRRRPERGASAILTSASAELLVGAVADLAALEEAAAGEQLPVRLGDRLRRDQIGRLLAAALGGDESRRRRLLALRDRDGSLRRLGREDAD